MPHAFPTPSDFLYQHDSKADIKTFIINAEIFCLFQGIYGILMWSFNIDARDFGEEFVRFYGTGFRNGIEDFRNEGFRWGIHPL
jgi:hypothetical protein